MLEAVVGAAEVGEFERDGAGVVFGGVEGFGGFFGLLLGLCRGWRGAGGGSRGTRSGVEGVLGAEAGFEGCYAVDEGGGGPGGVVFCWRVVHGAGWDMLGFGSAGESSCLSKDVS